MLEQIKPMPIFIKIMYFWTHVVIVVTVWYIFEVNSSSQLLVPQHKIVKNTQHCLKNVKSSKPGR